jgi:hypothetical protein
MESEPKLEGLTAYQLLKCARYIRALAMTATTVEERVALDLLADRFRVLAVEQVDHRRFSV